MRCSCVRHRVTKAHAMDRPKTTATATTEAKTSSKTIRGRDVGCSTLSNLNKSGGTLESCILQIGILLRPKAAWGWLFWRHFFYDAQRQFCVMHNDNWQPTGSHLALSGRIQQALAGGARQKNSRRHPTQGSHSPLHENGRNDP
jgi:hypothetical protein